MSCDVGEVTERLENEQSYIQWSRAHSPTFPSLHLRHSSFSNPSVASPTSQFILHHKLFTKLTWQAAHASRSQLSCLMAALGSKILLSTFLNYNYRTFKPLASLMIQVGQHIFQEGHENFIVCVRYVCVRYVCVWYICKICRSDHVTLPLEKLSWLLLRERRTFHSLFLLFNILNTSTPRYLSNRFSRLSQFHNLRTRSQQCSVLSIHSHNTSLYSSTFTVCLAKTWNSLLLPIRDQK